MVKVANSMKKPIHVVEPASGDRILRSLGIRDYYFTADEHYYHRNIIDYCNRPFTSVEEMNETMIDNHNTVVGENDVTIHAGDFTLLKDKKKIYGTIIGRLNGTHIFLKGSHDYWLKGNNNQIWEKKIGKNYIVVCHYAMRVWARSHYNSFQLYGHSHGNLPPEGKQYDIGVDNNDFFPVSLRQIINIMKTRPDNFNLVKRRK
jgi:calcineurin-like phosphoesterase family protein